MNKSALLLGFITFTTKVWIWAKLHLLCNKCSFYLVCSLCISSFVLLFFRSKICWNSQLWINSKSWRFWESLRRSTRSWWPILPSNSGWMENPAKSSWLRISTIGMVLLMWQIQFSGGGFISPWFYKEAAMKNFSKCVGKTIGIESSFQWNPKTISATLLKLTLLHGCFSRFLNSTNSIKSRNAPHFPLSEINWKLWCNMVHCLLHYGSVPYEIVWIPFVTKQLFLWLAI